MSSTDENETLADIVAEYRNDADAMDRGELYQPTTEYLRRLLDRIEAIDSADAWRSLYSPGNAAAMREALENLTRFAEVDIRGLENLAKYAIDHSMYGGGVLRAVAGAIREGKIALSAPPRNCDVGTAEEQMKKFREFCKTEKCGRYRCRSGCKATCIDKCAIAWAQMPYEEGGDSSGN